MAPVRTPEGKQVIYRVSTGEPFVRWPVDAQRMLETGEYTAAPPTPAIVADAAPVAPVSEQLPPDTAGAEAVEAPEPVAAAPKPTPRRRR